MTFDPTLPVQTRDGRKARILCTDFKYDPNDRTIVATIDMIGFEGKASFLYLANGKTGDCGDPHPDPHPADLINIPEKRWINIYPPHSTSPRWHCVSKADADRSASHDRIACLEFTEGDGL